MFKIEMPKAARYIIETLEDNGYEAYVVGGCVRDALLSLEPKDWDMTTSATPLEVKACFKKTIDTGIQHGTVTVMIDSVGYEVTTYRIDGEYNDNRRPDTVCFTGNLVEDLKRRDFTINAMAYNDNTGLVDAFDGVKDLEEGIVRCVGSAHERFNEDALRMLRAIRFAARFGFDIDHETVQAMADNCQLIENISVERILVELTKTLISDNPDYINRLVELGLMKFILPEFCDVVGLEQDNPYHIYTVDQHTIATIKASPKDKVIRWTMLLHDLGKATTKTVDDEGVGHFYGHVQASIEIGRHIMNRLKFDNDTKYKVLKLVEFHDYRIPAKQKSVRKLVSKLGKALFDSYIAVRRADMMGQNGEYLKAGLDNLEGILACYKEILENEECTTVKELKVNGKDLIDLGISQGKLIGEVLNYLLEVVLEDPSKNEKTALIELVRQYAS